MVTINNNSSILAKCLSDQSNELANEWLNGIEHLKPTNQQLNWSKEMKDQGQILTRNAIMQKLNELDGYNQVKESDMANTYKINVNDTSDQAMLKILVSSSMPKNLLKVYHQQAVQYGGSLVFKGLPEGSFQGLAKLVMAISDNGEIGSMQIDDEVFDHLAITAVPTILLIKEEDCLEGKYCKVTYDKITGSIGVKAALEQFAADGDLASEAQRLLND